MSEIPAIFQVVGDQNSSKSAVWNSQAKIVRMCEKDGMTMRAIGAAVGCSRETIRTILHTAGVAIDPRRVNVKRPVDIDRILRLYVKDELNIREISEIVLTRPETISKVLRSHGIKIDKSRIRRSVSYPELWRLEVGESIELPRMHSTSKYTYVRYYEMAKNARIKVSVRLISNDKVLVTRKE